MRRDREVENNGVQGTERNPLQSGGSIGHVLEHHIRVLSSQKRADRIIPDDANPKSFQTLNRQIARIILTNNNDRRRVDVRLGKNHVFLPFRRHRNGGPNIILAILCLANRGRPRIHLPDVKGDSELLFNEREIVRGDAGKFSVLENSIGGKSRSGVRRILG